MVTWGVPHGCVLDHTYRIRFFSGRSYSTTQSSQRIVLSSMTNSLHFTAENVPSGRHLYAIVSCSLEFRMTPILDFYNTHDAGS